MPSTINASASDAAQTITNEYRYTATFTLVLSDESIELNPMYIKSIIVDYNYTADNTMPLIYLTITLDNKIIYKLLDNLDTGLITFNIQRYVKNSDMPIYEDYIKDEFVYFMSNDLNLRRENQNQEVESDDMSGTNFTVITIGLMALRHVNNNKKTLNGVIKRAPMMSLIYYLIGDDVPVLMEKFQHNMILKNIVVPPLESKNKLIKYLNDISAFYDTSYMYFMDFDVVYFMSTSGTMIAKKGDEMNDVIITLLKFNSMDAKYQGMTIDTDNKAYRLNIPDDYAKKADNKVVDKSYKTVVATGTDQKSVKSAVDTSTAEYMKEKRSMIRIPNDNHAIVNNIISDINNSATTIVIQKTDLDSQVLTPNKRYMIDAAETYGVKYSGQYLLSRKREIYIREDDTFTMDTILTLNKIATSGINT